jgi:hypothetical protein
LRTNAYASDRLKGNICSPSKFLKIFALSDLECTIYLVYSLWDSSFLSVTLSILSVAQKQFECGNSLHICNMRPVPMIRMNAGGNRRKKEYIKPSNDVFI